MLFFIFSGYLAEGFTFSGLKAGKSSGSPFFCFLFFGEAKKRKSPGRRNLPLN
jgi:hypothetical protein